MELKKKRVSPILIFSSLWMVLILALGTWWLYLIVTLGKKIDLLDASSLHGTNWSSMVKWEGIFFFTLLILLSTTLLIFYLRDTRRNKSFHAFFASLTHELKTPLASIQLQAEVLQEKLKEHKVGGDIEKLTNRLTQDTQKLEYEFDKILQLSRIEKGSPLNLDSIAITPFVEKFFTSYPFEIEYKIQDEGNKALRIKADQFALTLVLRNLVENTLKHRKTSSSPISIKISSVSGDRVALHYNDHGGAFTGDHSKLGTLFYRHNSKKGSGIGLYLISKLMKKMDGKVSFHLSPEINFTLVFEQGVS
ncbi:MAG: HAMP domain-containing histidine kinase [Bacteriovoracaceae bacterium]|jgi:K+-sensing histidine kinase KdpD|nr:HAMP domain-containing histidine kinase [Bacteriovoracaceae bacterium]